MLYDKLGHRVEDHREKKNLPRDYGEFIPFHSHHTADQAYMFTITHAS